MSLEAHPIGERTCLCVAVHSPAQLPNEAEGHHVWPLGYDGPDVAENMRWLCLPGQVPVTMGDGSLRRIDHIGVGNVVLGHDGLPHHVTGVKVSHATEDLVRLDDLLLTADHLVLTRAGWLPAGCLGEGDEVRRLEPIGERVQSHVLSLVAAQPQIAGPIIVRDEVDVVYDLGGGQLASEQCGHDQARALHDAAFAAAPRGDDDVSLIVQPSFAAILHGPRDTLQRNHAARITAELRRATARPLAPGSEDVAALQAVADHRRTAAVRRGAGGGAGGVPRGVRRRVLELFVADDAALHSKCGVSAAKGRWDALQHVERFPHNGPLFDITIADSQSFVAAGTVVHNCPTTHTKVHNLWREWVKCAGEPPWEIMRRYSRFVRALVASGWSQVESAGRVHAVRAMMSANDHDAEGSV